MSTPPPIQHWSRYRTFGLIILAIVCLRLGVAYTPLTKPSTIPLALRFITAIFPLWLLGMGWLVLTLASLAAIYWRRLHDIVFVVATTYTLYWMLAYVFAQFDKSADPPFDATRAWNSAWIYLIIAMCIGFIGFITRLPKNVQVDEDPEDEDEDVQRPDSP